MSFSRHGVRPDTVPERGPPSARSTSDRRGAVRLSSVASRFLAAAGRGDPRFRGGSIILLNFYV
jgi:hypothetical protein